MASYLSSAASYGASFLTTGVIGTVGCKLTENLAKLGNPLSYLDKLTPNLISNLITSGPLHRFVKKLNISIFHFCNSMKLGSSTGIPVLEEFIFRFGIQGGITAALIYCGVEKTAAGAIGTALSSLIFAMSHGHSMNSKQCLDLTLKGAIFGAAYEYDGFTGAVGAHAIHNFQQHYINPILKQLMTSSNETGVSNLRELAKLSKTK